MSGQGQFTCESFTNMINVITILILKMLEFQKSHTRIDRENFGWPITLLDKEIGMESQASQ